MLPLQMAAVTNKSTVIIRIITIIIILISIQTTNSHFMINQVSKLATIDTPCDASNSKHRIAAVALILIFCKSTVYFQHHVYGKSRKYTHGLSSHQT